MIRRLAWNLALLVVVICLAPGLCGKSFAAPAASETAPTKAPSDTDAPSPTYIKVPAATLVAMQNYVVDKDGMVTFPADALPRIVS